MQPAQRFVVKADATTHLAWLRTRLALERTLMAGVRTATGLIGFGFTIVQFFYRFAQSDTVTLKYPAAPGYLGLALIAAGVLQLVVFLVHHRGFLAHLWGPDFKEVAGVQREPGSSPSIWVALLVILIGVFAFSSVLAQLL
jgi:putative membrane protein